VKGTPQVDRKTMLTIKLVETVNELPVISKKVLVIRSSHRSFFANKAILTSSTDSFTHGGMEKENSNLLE